MGIIIKRKFLEEKMEKYFFGSRSKRPDEFVAPEE